MTRSSRPNLTVRALGFAILVTLVVLGTQNSHWAVSAGAPKANSGSRLATSPLPGVFYTVTGTADNTDVVIHGGTGTAGNPFQMSSLRGAILNANTILTGTVGPVTISVPAGTYQLSVNNPNTPAVTGTIDFPDLEIGSTFNQDTTIVGIGGTPKIQQTVSGNDVITTGFQSDGFTPEAVTLTLQNLEIIGGEFSGIFTGVDNASGRSHTTLTNCNVNGNSDPFGAGGGIFNQTGDLTVGGCTFANNTAASQGGAIFYDLPNSDGSPGTFGSLIVTNSTFTNNSATAPENVAGGAIVFFGPNRIENTYSVTGSTFLNNHANGSNSKGGAIGAASIGTLHANLNRFVGNTAAGAGSAVAGQGATPIEAINNWWGCDDSPGGAGCDTVSGTGVISSPRLDLVLTSTPGCGSATLTADFSKNSANESVSPTVLNGLTVNFALVIGPPGSFVSPASATISGFMASSSLTASSASTVSATLDNGTQTALVGVNESTTATPLSDQTVCKGTSASFSTTAGGTGPFHYAWTVDGSPFGGDTSSINVSTGSLSTGNHPVTVTVTGACGSASQSATLTVNEATSTTDPADQTVCKGVTASFSTTASGTGPFHYAWTLDGSPFNGDSPSINVPTGSLSSGPHTVSVTTTGACGSASQSATLTVGAPPTITLSTTTVSLWPPNHQYHTFNVSDFVASASGCNGDLTSSVVIASVSSDEPEDNLSGADGSTLNDIVIAPDCKSVQLRAERDSNLNGRVYTITFKVTDSQGNSTTATARVTVPVNQNGAPAVDDGAAAGYTVLSSCP